ncbi:helix-turn-helix domain-containing protein [Nocardia brasiliensis]
MATPLDPVQDPQRVLAERVRALRVSTGRSQRSLAREIFLSHTMVNRVETGHWPISWDTVWAVVTGCGVPETDQPLWRDLWQQALAAHASRTVVVPKPVAPNPAPPPDAVPPRHQNIRIAQPSLFDDLDLQLDLDLDRSEQRFQSRRAPIGPARYVVSRARVLRVRDHYRAKLFKPDRDRVRTVPDFIDALQQLRASVNYPSWRQMAERGQSNHNTLHDLIRPGRVELKWTVVQAFLVGCGLLPREVLYWHHIFQRLRVRPRPKSLRRSDPQAPPPSVDLTGLDSVPSYIDALKELAGASKRSTDEVVRTARIHPGAQILGRSALFGRFRRALDTGLLPERAVVVGYLRGCYCRTLGRRCVPDCNADLIEPWLRIYDELHERTATSVAAGTGDHETTPLWVQRESA